ncbi:hypothetical protein ABT352_36310 [Streptosporangium sp. NPDC000563]|uniref:hypothetical protein n=1 Tax=Streptosporangium sp. NPDC000563 TaxID=3154366 RepID=UPI0033271B1B
METPMETPMETGKAREHPGGEQEPGGTESMTKRMTNFQRMKNRSIYLVKALERYFV